MKIREDSWMRYFKYFWMVFNRDGQDRQDEFHVPLNKKKSFDRINKINRIGNPSFSYLENLNW